MEQISQDSKSIDSVNTLIKIFIIHSCRDFHIIANLHIKVAPLQRNILESSVVS